MVTTGETEKSLRIARIFQIICLIAVMLFAGILYWNPDINEISRDMALGANVLKIMTIVLVVLGILCLLSGYFLSRVIIKARQVNPTGKNVKIFPFFFNVSPAERSVLTARFFLIFGYPAVAIYGLVLGMLGDGWQITLPFFVVSGIALILTFPTKNRWQRMMEKLNVDKQGDPPDNLSV
jgi:ATP/ADP translocase